MKSAYSDSNVRLSIGTPSGSPISAQGNRRTEILCDVQQLTLPHLRVWSCPTTARQRKLN